MEWFSKLGRVLFYPILSQHSGTTPILFPSERRAMADLFAINTRQAFPHKLVDSVVDKANRSVGQTDIHAAGVKTTRGVDHRRPANRGALAGRLVTRITARKLLGQASCSLCADLPPQHPAFSHHRIVPAVLATTGGRSASRRVRTGIAENNRRVLLAQRSGAP